jgi:protein subunit release factor B
VTVIPESELEFRFFRAGGPGGQNVNKVSTAVQMRFDVRNSPSLTEPVRARLMKLAGSRLTLDGVILITAVRYRTQERNRADAVERLQGLALRLGAFLGPADAQPPLGALGQVAGVELLLEPNEDDVRVGFSYR